jgi:hypothetical protein
LVKPGQCKRALGKFGRYWLFQNVSSSLAAESDHFSSTAHPAIRGRFNNFFAELFLAI